MDIFIIGDNTVGGTLKELGVGGGGGGGITYESNNWSNVIRESQTISGVDTYALSSTWNG